MMAWVRALTMEMERSEIIWNTILNVDLIEFNVRMMESKEGKNQDDL